MVNKRKDWGGLKKIALLGSTGSIGCQTLKLIENDSNFHVDLLAAGKNIGLLEKQIYQYKPRYAFVKDESLAKVLKEKIESHSSCTVISDLNLLLELIRNNKYEKIVNAIVGMAGILPTLAAVETGQSIAIANKETLVCAGHLLMPLAKETGAEILPIDSEHSAIAQCLTGEDFNAVDYIIITASGGPFYDKKDLDLEKVTVEDALAHPNWSMGAKISIDSATMVNKALEVMEAKWLFHLTLDRIKVLIHPKSIVHSMVCFQDGAVKAQLGLPDMALPIAYALYGYKRMEAKDRLDLAKICNLSFYPVDKGRFLGFDLGMEAAKIGGSMPTVFNAANETAVSKFLNRNIGFMDIPKIIDSCMQGHSVIKEPTIEDILNIGRELGLE